MIRLTFGSVTLTALIALSGCASTSRYTAPDTTAATANHGNEKPQPTTTKTPGDKPVSAKEVFAKQGDVEVLDVVEEFWENGNLKMRQGIKLDAGGEWVVHGDEDTFHEDGNKKSHLQYIDGILDGERITWFSNGKTWSQGQYDHGKGKGTWTVWYATGGKAQEWNFIDGAFDGTFTVWHPNGNRARQIEYVNGIKQGFEMFWDEAGEIADKKEFVDGVPQP